MRKLENEWKRVRMGWHPATPPLLVEQMHSTFIAGALAMFKIITEAKPDEFTNIRQEIEREAEVMIEKGKLIAKIQEDIARLNAAKK